MNLFLSLLTHPAPSANHRGESEQNRTPVQKLIIGQEEYPVISPEAIRNGLREMLADYGLPCNRRRERNADQPAVSFLDYPDPDRFIDDFFFGYMVTNRDQIPKARRSSFVYKRDSILRNNLAVGLCPYLQETLFTQAPKTINRDDPKEPPAWSNADSAQLLHREMVFTAYQMPLALNLDDCQLDQPQRKLWLAYLLQALSELSYVAGNAARSYFEMAPVSIVARLTPRMASGFPLYPFQPDGSLPAVLRALRAGQRPGEGYHLGGEVLDTLSKKESKDLVAKGVTLHATAEALLSHLSEQLCGHAIPVQEPTA